MKPPSALLKTLLGLCLFFGTALAQPILTSYRDATEALRASVTAFPNDQVESLDTLRRAETAFEPLGAALEPTLRQGLNETFSRAEEAIVNQSETDLQVQAAVLQGGFGRAVYQQALESAANGDLASAQNFLGVLGQDLGLADTQFTGASQDALQGTFEARLAARSLEELGTFGGDLENRYRTLAQLYSYIFLVQDSPRLPLKTRDTVVGTIRALVAERPTDEGISLLQAQLTGFARAAERAEAQAASTQTGSAGQRDGAAQDSGTATETTPNQTAGTTDTGTTDTATTGANPDTASSTVAGTASDVAGSANPDTANPEAASSGTTDPDAAPFTPPVTAAPGDAITEGNAQPTFPDTVSDQATTTENTTTENSTAENSTGDTAVLGTISALPFLTPDVWALLFAAAGLLALTGIVQLSSTPSLSPWRDAALALLLLPVLLEGLVALAGLLEPVIGQPFLAQIGAYSLFTNPVTQLVWVLLSAAAVLCLALSWRAERHTDRHTVEDETDEVEYVARQDAPQPTRSTPLTTSNLNWDEDF